MSAHGDFVCYVVQLDVGRLPKVAFVIFVSDSSSNSITALMEMRACTNSIKAYSTSTVLHEYCQIEHVNYGSK